MSSPEHPLPEPAYYPEPDSEVDGDHVFNVNENTWHPPLERPEPECAPLRDDQIPVSTDDASLPNPELEKSRHMVTVDEASERLGITPRAVQRIVAKGHARAESRPVSIEVPVLFVDLDDLRAYRARVAKFGGRPRRPT